MKIVLYSRPEMKRSEGELNLLMEAILEAGLDYMVYAPFADVINASAGIEIPEHKRFYDFVKGCCEADVAVSYGGDGTFLDCVKLLGPHSIPILGINSGRLGFLANVPKTEIKQAFDDLKNKRYRIRKSSLLEASGDFAEKPEYTKAFNEFSIQRGGGNGMISVETYVDGEMVATYWADGVLLSTPAGSTAYSLSVGGPVVAPECGCFVLSPIAPHNLTMRPVVVPDNSEVTFRINSRGNNVNVSIDSESYEARDGAKFIVKKAESSVYLIILQNISFYDTLRNKMMWGIDRRDTSRQ